MSEQETPRTVEEAAREYINRRHDPMHDRGVGIVQGSHYRTGFVAGATWQAARMPSAEEVAEVLAAHAIRGVRDGLWHCECGATWAVNVFDPKADLVAVTRHQAERVVALWGAP